MTPPIPSLRTTGGAQSWEELSAAKKRRFIPRGAREANSFATVIQSQDKHFDKAVKPETLRRIRLTFRERKVSSGRAKEFGLNRCPFLSRDR